MTTHLLTLMILVGIGRVPSAERVLDDFPLIQQPDPTSCGPTCVAMELRYYGADRVSVPPSAGELRFRVRMMSPQGLAEDLARHGITARVDRGDLGLLVTAIDQGRPPILLVRLSPYMWHYVVAVGYQGRGQRFRLADPLGRMSWIDAEDLERAWAFEGDLKGRRLEDQRCGVCNGGGLVQKCLFCGGTGKAPDTARKFVEALDLTSHLLIVPDQAPRGIHHGGTESTEKSRGEDK
jgi:hypothetical protein